MLAITPKFHISARYDHPVPSRTSGAWQSLGCIGWTSGQGRSPPLCKTKVCDLWVHFLQGVVAVDVPKIVVASVYCRLPTGFRAIGCMVCPWTKVSTVDGSSKAIRMLSSFKSKRNFVRDPEKESFESWERSTRVYHVTLLIMFIRCLIKVHSRGKGGGNAGSRQLVGDRCLLCAC